MTVRFWVVLAIATVAGLLVTVTGWLAYHEHGEAVKARVSYAAVSKKHTALLKLQEQTQETYRLRYQPVPSLRSVTPYGAPYNVTIVCTVRGSSEGFGDERIPLDPSYAPAPGDVYQKTCRGFAPSEAPSG